MNLLVTGGAGFIGSSYVRMVRRARPGDRVVNVDALTYAGNLENLRDLENDGGHVFVRVEENPPGPRVAKIKKVYGPSITHRFRTKRVQAAINRVIRERWPIEFERELKYRMGT